MVYQFQCHRCFIVSGRMSTDPDDAPLCCGGEQMVAFPMEKGNLTPRAADEVLGCTSCSLGLCPDGNGGYVPCTICGNTVQPKSALHR